MARHRLLLAHTFGAALLATTAMPLPAHAGDAPPAEVRARIETYLRTQSFTRWDEIESDDNGRVWKVDDARHTDGKKYELKLNAQTLQEVDRRLD